MRFKMEFDCDNAAFGDDATDEIWRILDRVQFQISNRIGGGVIQDSNGARIGRWEFVMSGSFAEEEELEYAEYSRACEAENLEPHTWQMWHVQGCPEGPLG